MSTNPVTPASAALVVSCPTDDVRGLADVLQQSPVALLPVGGVGALARAAGVTTVLLVEIGPEGPLRAITWCATVATATPLADDIDRLIPGSWVRRHPDAYARSRAPVAAADRDDVDDEDDWDEPDDEDRVQIFLPISVLERLPRDRWIFANELVPKQEREGRTYAPRVPAVVMLPDD